MKEQVENLSAPTWVIALGLATKANAGPAPFSSAHYARRISVDVALRSAALPGFTIVPSAGYSERWGEEAGFVITTVAEWLPVKTALDELLFGCSQEAALVTREGGFAFLYYGADK